MIEDLPLMSINLKIWKFFGLIKYESIWKAAAVNSLPLLVTLVFQVMYLFKTWGNVEGWVLNTFMGAIMCNAIVRISSVMWYQEVFLEFMNGIVEFLKEAEKRSDTTAMDKFNSVTETANQFSIKIFTLAVIGSVGATMTPIFSDERDLPLPLWMPLIDVQQSPYYEITFGIEITFVIPFLLSTYVPFTNLFITWLMFGIACLEILQNDLSNVMTPPGTDEEIDAALYNCIEYHLKIIRFSEQLNVMLSLTHLVEFVLCSVILCVLLIFMLTVKRFLLQLTAVLYVCCIFYCSLLFYLYANELSFQSSRVAEVAYNIEWYDGSIKFRKNILIMMIRSQRPLQLSAGGMFPMTLETFHLILKATYSYFTLLKNMRQ